MTLRAARPLLAAAAVATLTGCTTTPGSSATTSAGGEVTVLVAASLGDVAERVADELADQGYEVRVQAAASSTLAHQVVEGAPADLLVTASPESLRPVLDAGLATDPVTVASNVVVAAVPADDPAGVDSADDLARPDVRVALCAPAVPCGAVAREVLAAAGIVPHVVTEEADVRAVLTKVELGEVDAGVVYRSDALGAGDTVRTVELPGAENRPTTYPAVVLADAANAGGARAFLDVLTSAQGRALLAGAGFGPP